MKKQTTLFALALLSGCASEQPFVDNSMKNPTAVFTAKGVVTGFILPDSTFTEATYTREDRRKMSTDTEYDSWFARQFFGNSGSTVIYRMDRNLRWTLVNNDGDKTYTECPLSGCAISGMKKFDPKKNPDNGEGKTFEYAPNDQKASACPVHITNNSFKVTRTGKSRTIAGHSSDEYEGNWVVEYQDKKGRKDSNRLKMVFWNAQPNADMKKVWAMSEKADKAYMKKIKQSNNALAGMIPENIIAVLSTFTGNLGSHKQWAKDVAKEMSKIKGYSMATSVAWYLDRNACIEQKEQVKKKEQSLDWLNPMEALSTTASNMAGEKAAEMFLPNPDEPILRYEYEVTSAEIKHEHDSIFDVPRGYKRIKQ